MARADLSDALRGGLLGVAVGEALGLPWVGVAPRAIGRDRLVDDVGPTGGATRAVLAWGRGQSLSAGWGLSPTAAAGDSPQAPALRDCPPTTAPRDSPLPAALAVGWRHRDHQAARHAAALPLGFAAVVVADLAAWALAGRPLHHLVADHADDWPPPFRGVAADDRSVLDALLAVLHRHDDPSEAMRAAVRLGGGGTAVLGALVGGILGCRRPTAIDRVAWRDRVALPDEATLALVIATLDQP